MDIEGYLTIASGDNSHTEGYLTVANGFASHAGGLRTNVNGVDGAFIIGKYGDAASTQSRPGEYGFFLAGGQGDINKEIVAKILNDGNMYLKGSVTPNGADYSEMFETVDGKSIDVGYFITFAKENKVRLANSNDDYILGVTSSNPSIIANANELLWSDKYLKDEWGRVKYDDSKPILNSNWDNKIEYESRLEREEWIVVGLLGQILVRDNGECIVDSYCKSGEGGIAIPSDKGYRVLKRTGENQILILFNGPKDDDYNYISQNYLEKNQTIEVQGKVENKNEELIKLEREVKFNKEEILKLTNKDKLNEEIIMDLLNKDKLNQEKIELMQKSIESLKSLIYDILKKDNSN